MLDLPIYGFEKNVKCQTALQSWMTTPGTGRESYSENLCFKFQVDFWKDFQDPWWHSLQLVWKRFDMAYRLTVCISRNKEVSEKPESLNLCGPTALFTNRQNKPKSLILLSSCHHWWWHRPGMSLYTVYAGCNDPVYKHSFDTFNCDVGVPEIGLPHGTSKSAIPTGFSWTIILGNLHVYT